MQTGTIGIKIILKTGWICRVLTAGCFFLALLSGSHVRAGTDSAPLSTWFVDMGRFAAGAHGTLKCEDCHGPMIGMGIKKDTGEPAIHPDPESVNFLKVQTRRNFDYQACQKCHKTAYERFGKGEHATAAVKEKTKGEPSKTGFAPACGDCHSSHYAESHMPRARVGQQMTETCGTCHPGQKASFLANYHGKAAVNLGYDKSAFCTDCHGAHTTISLKDKDKALNACRRCHADATPEFADIIIHDTPDSFDLKSETKQSGLKWIQWLGTLSLVFVVGVLLFFYLHTGLLLLRKLHEKLRRHK
ncbi:MAG: hypothetical protein A2097_08320 [Desulfobacula sp. GWF2_41_7]|nr:MAG: hypothetical protein A2097_08320 [Desulfobacula sp. GWF2_41_7]